MTTKEYLYQARKIDYEIDALIEARAKLYEQCTKATTMFSAMPKGGSNPHKYDKLAEMNDMIDRKLAEAVCIKYDVLYAILQLDDRIEKSILIDFYIQGLSAYEIARKLNYSVKQIKRLKINACKKITLSQNMSPNVP